MFNRVDCFPFGSAGKKIEMREDIHDRDRKKQVNKQKPKHIRCRKHGMFWAYKVLLLIVNEVKR